MKIVKITSMLVLLMSLMSCEKESGEIAPDTTKELAKIVDITNYVIIGKSYLGIEQIPYLISLHADGKARFELPGGHIPYSYTYNDEVLTLDQNGGNLIRIRIRQDSISSFISTTKEFASYQLIKIPSTNLLAGNSFGGVWKMIVAGASAPQLSTVKFTDTQYAEATLYNPIPNKSYSVLHNIAAKTLDPVTQHAALWVLMDGKLEGYRYNLASEKHYSGTFIKQ